jgi:hypothetical protein
MTPNHLRLARLGRADDAQFPLRLKRLSRDLVPLLLAGRPPSSCGPRKLRAFLLPGRGRAGDNVDMGEAIDAVITRPQTPDNASKPGK